MTRGSGRRRVLLTYEFVPTRGIMRRTVVSSVSLLPDLAKELGKVAKELGKPKSQVFREAVEAYLRLHRFRKLQATLARRGPVRGARGEESVERLVHDFRRAKKA